MGEPDIDDPLDIHIPENEGLGVSSDKNFNPLKIKQNKISEH